MWWFVSAQAATVEGHPCTTALFSDTSACRCLAADPGGPAWWGGVDVPDVDDTCFDVDAVLAEDPVSPTIADTLLRRAQRLADDRGYRLDPLLGLVSQEDKVQLSARFTLVGWTSPYELHEDGKPIAWLDTAGRVPWPDVTASDEDGDGNDDGLVVAFGSGEVWVVVGPLLDGELVVLPKPDEKKD